jgi:hypothetical protein
MSDESQPHPFASDPLLRVLLAAEILAYPTMNAQHGGPPATPTGYEGTEMFAASLAYVKSFQGSRAIQFRGAMRALALMKAQCSALMTLLPPEMAIEDHEITTWARAAEALGEPPMRDDLLAAAKEGWEQIPAADRERWEAAARRRVPTIAAPHK